MHRRSMDIMPNNAAGPAADIPGPFKLIFHGLFQVLGYTKKAVSQTQTRSASFEAYES